MNPSNQKENLKKIFVGVGCFLSLILLNQCMGFSSRPKVPKFVKSQSGLNIPKWSIAIDGYYNKALDNLVPGYKIVHVAVANRSSRVVSLSPSKDRWQLILHSGEKIRVVNDINQIKSRLPEMFPAQLLTKLAYPDSVKIAHAAKIDLLVPARYPLEKLAGIHFKSPFFKTEFQITLKSQTDLKTRADKNQELPKEEGYRGTPTKENLIYQISTSHQDGGSAQNKQADQNDNRRNQNDSFKPKKRESVSIPMD